MSKIKSPLTIYKASAGSGKTFMLTQHYLSLALNSENNYRRILAITFTRKATAEMRQRILGELQIISENPDKSAHTETLCSELSITTEEISKRAKKLQQQIVHDYSNFAVTTIDSFFQQIIRSFARELNILNSYRIELNENKIIERAITNMLDNAQSNESLMQLLIKYVKNFIIIEGRSHIIDRDIYSFAKTMLREDLKNVFVKIGDSGFENQIDKLQNEMKQNVKTFEENCEQKYKQYCEFIETFGLQPDSFSTKSNLRKFYEYLNKKEFKEDYLINIYSDDFSEIDENKIFTKDFLKENRNFNITNVYSRLSPLYNEDITYFRNNFGQYFFSKHASTRLWYLRFFRYIWSELNNIKQNDNLFILSDSPVLLSQITDESDTPFIFEKIAAIYNHILIDEFQDTSKLQWQNLKPLFEHIISQFNSNKALGRVNNLIVGDVKQAIYRFRNGDWELLHQRVTEQFKNFKIDEEYLQTNWRSEPSIIDFNNKMFELLPVTIDLNYLYGMPQFYTESLNKLYNKHSQNNNPHKKQDNGYVSVYTVEKEDYKTKTLDLVTANLLDLLNNKIEQKDIAILVRKKDDGQLIAQHLLSLDERVTGHSIKIAMSDVLYLENSNSVKAIIAALTWLTDTSVEFYLNMALWFTWSVLEKEHINFFETELNNRAPKLFEQNISLISKMPVYQIVPVLIEALELNVKSEIPFISRFQDIVVEFIQNNPSDIKSFLDYWQEEGENIKLSAPKSQNAVQILTIHKSKGLEFDHVILPFVDWQIIRTGKNDMWISDSERFGQMHLQVPFNKTAAFSIYNQQLYEEYYNSVVDSLNLVYVAFTRPVKSLSIYIPAKPTSGTIGTWILNALQNQENWTGTFHSEELLPFYSQGFPTKPDSCENNPDKTNFHEIESLEFNNYQKLGIRSVDRHYSDDDSYEMFNINFGNVMHRIMEQIVTVNDLERAIKNVSIRGEISDNDIASVKEKINSLLALPSVKHWFDGSSKVYNERVLISQEGKIRRPDRIMQTSDGKWIIVDYKFGSEKNTLYEEQIRNYTELLEKSGRKIDEAYIWYMQNGELRRV